MSLKRILSKLMFFCGIISLILIFPGCNSMDEVNLTSNFNGFVNKTPHLSYIVHTPIIITSDNDFITYGFPGNGSETDPYIIENYNITTEEEVAIKIDSTTKSFVIQNCLLNTSLNGLGIEIRSISEGEITINDNTCVNNGIGIYIIYTEGVSILNNNCTAGGYGIGLGSTNCLVKNNICQKNTVGIDIGGLWTVNNTIAKNDCSLNDYGIRYQESSNNTFAENYCNVNQFGFFIDRCSNSIFLNNTCSNSDQGFYETGTECSNMTYELNKCNYNEYHGMRICSSFSVLINNSCNYGVNHGISLGFVNNSIVNDNTCKWNHASGISLYDSHNNTVSGNSCSFGDIDGLCILASKDNNISYNLFKNNDYYGVVIASEISLSTGNIVHHNAFIRNNLRQFLGTSQACDSGENNLWYDPVLLEGNYWDDYQGFMGYQIDGSANSTDPYPISNPFVGEYNNNFNYSFYFFIPVVLFFIVSKKKKKKN